MAGVDILSLLWEHHSSQCSDEKDRLFALYGLVSRDGSTSFDKLLSFEPRENCPIDYSRHFTEIYIRLATAAVKHGLGALVISHCFAFGVLADQDPDWPSWVPSWNVSRQVQTMYSRDILYFEKDPVSMEQSYGRPSIQAMGKRYPIGTISKRRGQVHDLDLSVLPFFRTSLRTAFRSSDESKGSEIMAKLLLRGIQTVESQYDRMASIQSMLKRRCENARKERSSSNEKDQILALRDEIERKTLSRDSYGCYDDLTLVKAIDVALKDCTLLRYNLYGIEAPGIAFGDITTGDYIFRLVGSEIEAHKSIIALVIRPQKLHNLGRHSSLGTYRIVGFCLDCYEWANLFKAQSKHGTLRRFTKSFVDPRESVIIF